MNARTRRSAGDPCADRRKSSPGLAGAMCLVMALIPHKAMPQQFWEMTQLVDARAGTSLSDIARQLGTGGYELSDGSPVAFSDWYSSSWTDLRLTWVTQVSQNFGVYWGFGTGERGPKYEIEPSLKLGLIVLQPVSRNGMLSLSATTVIGGAFNEGTCTADYGAIGGTQTVNCRLAASVLPPEETLAYLVHEKPADRFELILRYRLSF
ncbi:hypothetical protein OM960_11400 [Defluviimonas sp. CAU 1641]|uniref:Uncharacterized protein n=3 Tax=Albidovulum TaxID=205889 RepID=A0ABT3J3C4_9RHOB|nr:hypothetical protein [Defluviimonas salinarum]